MKENDNISTVLTEERRSNSKKFVERLTIERTEMLTLYCRVAGIESFEESSNKDNFQEVLQKFCQLLVDYIALGQFSLYERIVKGEERRGKVSLLAEKLYPMIASTMEIAMEFNDKYDCEDHCNITDDFEADLSRLGEALASRIEAEDKLLHVLH